MFEQILGGAAGHIRILDKNTREVLRDVPNAVHYGNISWAIAHALVGLEQGFIRYMIFGSGGTTVDSAGRILYRQTNTSNIQDPNALPYNPTFFRELEPAGAPTGNNSTVISGFENFADIVTTVTLTFGEPSDQDISDEVLTRPEYVFDEIALYTTPTNLPNSRFTPFDDPVTPPDTPVGRFQSELETAGGRMLTHVIFHPIHKSGNRELEIEYTLRIAMGP